MTYIALAAIAAGLFLLDRLCPKIKLSGSPYSWPTPLVVLTLISAVLMISGTITVSIVLAIGGSRLKCGSARNSGEPHGLQAGFSRKCLFQVQTRGRAAPLDLDRAMGWGRNN